MRYLIFILLLLPATAFADSSPFEEDRTIKFREKIDLPVKAEISEVLGKSRGVFSIYPFATVSRGTNLEASAGGGLGFSYELPSGFFLGGELQGTVFDQDGPDSTSINDDGNAFKVNSYIGKRFGLFLPYVGIQGLFPDDHEAELEDAVQGLVGIDLEIPLTGNFGLRFGSQYSYGDIPSDVIDDQNGNHFTWKFGVIGRF